jgi:hypothetical protein
MSQFQVLTPNSLVGVLFFVQPFGDKALIAGEWGETFGQL